MKVPLPNRRLPERPDIDQLRRQAKELLEEFRSGEPGAIAEVSAHYHDLDKAGFALHDAQLVIARAYGFESWAKLKGYVDGVTVQRLAAAVRAGDIEQVGAVLKIRPELVDARLAWNNEYTALHFAVLGRMPEMVRLLMHHGADARAGISPHNEATSPTTIARERGYDDIVEIILDAEKQRETARQAASDVLEELRQALRSGSEEGVISILERRPGLIGTEQLPGGWTLLHAASALLLPRLAAWLLDRAAAVNHPAKDGSTPLDVVGRYCDPAERSDRMAAMVELLRTRGAQMTPRSAVILGDVNFLRAEHARGRLMTPRDENGWLLGVAVEYDRPDILSLLLNLGLDPDARVRVDSVDEFAFTWGMPLYHCARYGKHAMAEILLEHGADPNAHVYASGTPLSEAYGQRDEKMIALLERYGGKANPSMAGFYRRKDLALKLLAEHGDAKLPDDGFGSGSVAEQLVHAAARGGDPEILKIALDQVDWPSGDTRWYGALSKPLEFWNHWIGPWCHPEWDRTGYLTCFKMILDRLGPPVARLRFGTTILHEIVTMGDHVTAGERAAFAAAALDAGARLDARDDLLKSTPLGWACRWGREELVRLLLDRGADPVEKDTEPWARPLAWADKKDHCGIATMLRLNPIS